MHLESFFCHSHCENKNENKSFNETMLKQCKNREMNIIKWRMLGKIQFNGELMSPERLFNMFVFSRHNFLVLLLPECLLLAWHVDLEAQKDSGAIADWRSGPVGTDQFQIQNSKSKLYSFSWRNLKQVTKRVSHSCYMFYMCSMTHEGTHCRVRLALVLLFLYNDWKWRQAARSALSVNK